MTATETTGPTPPRGVGVNLTARLLRSVRARMTAIRRELTRMHRSRRRVPGDASRQPARDIVSVRALEIDHERLAEIRDYLIQRTRRS